MRTFSLYFAGETVACSSHSLREYHGQHSFQQIIFVVPTFWGKANLINTTFFKFFLAIFMYVGIFMHLSFYGTDKDTSYKKQGKLYSIYSGMHVRFNDNRWELSLCDNIYSTFDINTSPGWTIWLTQIWWIYVITIRSWKHNFVLRFWNRLYSSCIAHDTLPLRTSGG